MNIESLAKAIELIKGEGTDGCEMYVTMIQALLCIASNPGISPSEIARHLVVAETTISRAKLRLEAERGSKHPGIGLIREEAGREDLRGKALYLTEKGERLITKLKSLP